MKVFISVVGLLTLAQWIFVGLLYGFLHAQEKTTPETMTKLHDFPVIGGYFPKVKIQTPEEKERKYGDDLRERLVDARRQWSLPPSYSEEEFIALLNDMKSRGERLKTESRNLEKLKIEVRTMVDEINRRETAVIADQGKLTKGQRSLEKEKQDVALSKKGQDKEIRKSEKKSNKDNANWFNNMTADAAKEKLLAVPKDATPNEIADTYRKAAQVLSLMDKEQAAKVIELIDPFDWVRIEEAKMAMPVDKK